MLRAGIVHFWSAAACRRCLPARLASPVGAIATLALLICSACNSGPSSGTVNAVQPAPVSAAPPSATAAAPPIDPADAAPPPSQTDGFDGAKAYDFTARLVAFGPRPPDTDAIRKTQDYIESQLKGFGCAVDTDSFQAQTPIGTLAMKNIIAKIPGSGPGIILLLTHYDTLRLENFVGADDAGSSTGLMLEMARLLCGGAKQPNAVWIAFLDGEEAQSVVNGVAQWTNTDSVYGSRELAARMAISGDLKKIKAVILADMIGQKDLHLLRESNSTKWLTNLVWRNAARLGYKDVFLSDEANITDDHGPFLARGVPAVDLIDYNDYDKAGYWHTPQDTMDKLSPRSLAIVGHVILESLAELQKR